jgi:hypothetical protein
MSDQPPENTKKSGKILWQKGQSGNPGGRPKVPEELREAFRALTPRAIRTLRKAMKEGGAVGVKASEVVLERGWGKVAQQIDATVTNLNDEERTRRVRELLGLAEGEEL